MNSHIITYDYLILCMKYVPLTIKPFISSSNCSMFTCINFWRVLALIEHHLTTMHVKDIIFSYHNEKLIFYQRVNWLNPNYECLYTINMQDDKKEKDWTREIFRNDITLCKKINTLKSYICLKTYNGNCTRLNNVKLECHITHRSMKNVMPVACWRSWSKLHH